MLRRDVPGELRSELSFLFSFLLFPRSDAGCRRVCRYNSRTLWFCSEPRGSVSLCRHERCSLCWVTSWVLQRFAVGSVQWSRLLLSWTWKYILKKAQRSYLFLTFNSSWIMQVILKRCMWRGRSKARWRRLSSSLKHFQIFCLLVIKLLNPTYKVSNRAKCRSAAEVTNQSHRNVCCIICWGFCEKQLNLNVSTGPHWFCRAFYTVMPDWFVWNHHFLNEISLNILLLFCALIWDAVNNPTSETFKWL